MRFAAPALAFDADAVVCAATRGHPLGVRVRRAVLDAPDGSRRLGSLVLLVETMSHPLRQGNDDELAAMTALLSRLDLRPLDRATAGLATELAAGYRLRAADAIHLATAVISGADAFVTNNGKDFGPRVDVIPILSPGDLPA